MRLGDKGDAPRPDIPRGDIPSLDDLRRRRDRYRRFVAPVFASIKFWLVLGFVYVTYIAVGPTWVRARSTMLWDRVARTGYRSGFATWGHRSTVTLPDGSTAALGPMSWIRYPGAPVPAAQDVSMEGEVAFTVAPDDGVFTVRARDIVVRALDGGMFTVAAPGDSPARDVKVQRGMVRVWRMDEPAALADTVRPGVEWGMGGDVPHADITVPAR